jgi:hypothetical protein
VVISAFIYKYFKSRTVLTLRGRDRAQCLDINRSVPRGLGGLSVIHFHLILYCPKFICIIIIIIVCSQAGMTIFRKPFFSNNYFPKNYQNFFQKKCRTFFELFFLYFSTPKLLLQLAIQHGHTIRSPDCTIMRDHEKPFFLIYLTKMPFTVKLNYGKTEISIQNWWWLFSLNTFFIYCNLFIYYLFIY